MWVAGKEKQVIKFFSPAGIEGIDLLALGDDEMGSYDYQKDYSCEIQSQDDASWTLMLKRKPSADRPYDRLVMVVDKSTSVPRTIESYKNDGQRSSFRSSK